MPLKQCTANGTTGWQFGNKGKCYTGPGAKKKAIKQAVAEGNASELSAAELKLYNEVDRSAELLESVTAYVTKKQRDETPEEDFGDPKNKKYPVKSQSQLKSAWDLSGRAENPDAVRKRLKEIAKRHGWKLPSTAYDNKDQK